MYTGKTVFSQVVDYLPMHEFRKCVDRYNGNYHTSSFSCLDQYLCMAFAQLTYLDFERLYVLTQLLAFFVTRAKKNNKFRRIYSHPVDRTVGLRCDQTIMLVTPKSLAGYPEKLRRVKYFDADRKKQFVFLTNNFVLPTLTIATLYKCRWQIELFFKWIKQHLRIKAFYGTSINAVKTQIWIAVSTYVLVAIIRKRLHLELNLYTILQILSVTLFEKVPLDQLFANYDYKYLPELKEPLCKQLNLFDY
jgi:hypothetical protein